MSDKEIMSSNKDMNLSLSLEPAIAKALIADIRNIADAATILSVEKEIPYRLTCDRSLYSFPIENSSFQLFKLLATLTAFTQSSFERAKRSKNKNKKYFQARILPISYVIANDEIAGDQPSKATISVCITQGKYLPPNIPIDDPGLALETANQKSALQTLGESVATERHVSIRNIIKWTYQMLGFLHTCQAIFICLGPLSLDDVRLLPDVTITGELSASTELAKTIKFRKLEKWRGAHAIREDIDNLLNNRPASRKMQLRAEKNKKKFLKKRLERDCWFDPHRWIINSRDHNLDNNNLCVEMSPTNTAKSSTENSPLGLSSRNKTVLSKEFLCDNSFDLHCHSLYGFDENGPKTFPLLQAYESKEKQGNGTCFIMDTEPDAVECVMQYRAYNSILQTEMRCFGIVLLQLATHTRYTNEEISILKNESLTSEELVDRYPSIVRLGSIYIELLSLCFAPPFEADVGYAINAPPGTIRMRCPIVRKCKVLLENFRIITEKLEQNVTWVKPPGWTETDEVGRQRILEQQHQQMVQNATIGIELANKRVVQSKAQLWFDLQPIEYQRKVLAKRAARKLSLKNKAERNYFLHQASFHLWKPEHGKAWVADAIFSILRSTYQLSKSLSGFLKGKMPKLPAAEVSPTKAEVVSVHDADNTNNASFSTNNIGSSFNSNIDGSMNQTSFNNSDSNDEGSVGSNSNSTNTNTNSTTNKRKHRKRKPRNNGLGTFQLQRIADLLLPLQTCLEKILIRNGYNYHGHKALPTPFEIDLDQENCYRALATKLPQWLFGRTTTRNLYSAIVDAKKKADARLDHSTLASVITNDELRIKKILTAAEYLAKSLSAVKVAMIELCRDIELLDRQWAKKMTVVLCIILLEKFDSTAWMRTKGEMLASAKITACVRQWKVRRIVKKIWQTADMLLRQQLHDEREERHRKIASGEVEVMMPKCDEELEEEEEYLYPVEVLGGQGKVTGLTVDFSVNLSQSQFGDSKDIRKYITCVGCVIREPISCENRGTAKTLSIRRQQRAVVDGKRKVEVTKVFSSTVTDVMNEIENNKSSSRLDTKNADPALLLQTSDFIIAGDSTVEISTGNLSPLSATTTAVNNKINDNTVNAAATDEVDEEEDACSDEYETDSDGENSDEFHGVGELLLIVYDARQLTDTAAVFKQYQTNLENVFMSAFEEHLVDNISASIDCYSVPQNSMKISASTMLDMSLVDQQASFSAANLSSRSNISGMSSASSRDNGNNPTLYSNTLYNSSSRLTTPDGNYPSAKSINNIMTINDRLHLATNTGSSDNHNSNNNKKGKHKVHYRVDDPRHCLDDLVSFPVTVVEVGPKHEAALLLEDAKQRRIALEEGRRAPPPLVSKNVIFQLKVKGLKPYCKYRTTVEMSDVFLAKTESKRRYFNVFEVKAIMCPMKGLIPVIRTLPSPPEVAAVVDADVLYSNHKTTTQPLPPFPKLTNYPTKQKSNKHFMEETECHHIPHPDNDTDPNTDKFRLIVGFGESKILSTPVTVHVRWLEPIDNGAFITDYIVHRRVVLYLISPVLSPQCIYNKNILPHITPYFSKATTLDNSPGGVTVSSTTVYNTLGQSFSDVFHLPTDLDFHAMKVQYEAVLSVLQVNNAANNSKLKSSFANPALLDPNSNTDNNNSNNSGETGGGGGLVRNPSNRNILNQSNKDKSVKLKKAPITNKLIEIKPAEAPYWVVMSQYRIQAVNKAGTSKLSEKMLNVFLAKITVHTVAPNEAPSDNVTDNFINALSKLPAQLASSNTRSVADGGLNNENCNSMPPVPLRNSIKSKTTSIRLNKTSTVDNHSSLPAIASKHIKSNNSIQTTTIKKKSDEDLSFMNLFSASERILLNSKLVKEFEGITTADVDIINNHHHHNNAHSTIEKLNLQQQHRTASTKNNKNTKLDVSTTNNLRNVLFGKVTNEVGTESTRQLLLDYVGQPPCSDSSRPTHDLINNVVATSSLHRWDPKNNNINNKNNKMDGTLQSLFGDSILDACHDWESNQYNNSNDSQINHSSQELQGFYDNAVFDTTNKNLAFPTVLYQLKHRNKTLENSTITSEKSGATRFFSDSSQFDSMDSVEYEVADESSSATNTKQLDLKDEEFDFDAYLSKLQQSCPLQYK